MSQKGVTPAPQSQGSQVEATAVAKAEAGSTRDDRRTPQELFRDLWSQALVTVGGAEEEVRGMLERLSGVFYVRPDDVQRQARELSDRLRSQRKDLERSIEESVKRALPLVRLPTGDELGALRNRLEALSQRIEQAAQRRGMGSP